MTFVLNKNVEYFFTSSSLNTSTDPVCGFSFDQFYSFENMKQFNAP